MDTNTSSVDIAATLARLAARSDGHNNRAVDALRDLRSAQDQWERAADGDSNDAEHEAGIELSQTADYVIETGIRAAEATIELTQFVRQVADFTVDGEPHPAEDGTAFTMTAEDAIDTVHTLVAQARDLIKRAALTGAPADPRAERVDVWADEYGVWHARIVFPLPGYDSDTLTAHHRRLRRRAQKSIRRALDERGAAGPGWRCRVTHANTGTLPGDLTYSITYREDTTSDTNSDASD